jgi:hypothetical protein
MLNDTVETKIAVGDKIVRAKSTSKAKPAARKAKAERPARGYDPAARITVLVKENPRQEGSERHRIFAELMRRTSSTVGDFLRIKGARTSMITNAVRRKWIKIA